MAMNLLRLQIQNTIDVLKDKLPWRLLLIAGVSMLLVAWWMYTPNGLLGKADAIGFAVCHRIDSRSFHLGDRQIPVCARCTGQYLGAMLGLIYLSILHPRRSGRPSWTVVGILIAFVIAYAVDGFNSYIHLMPGLSRFYLYEPNNTFRLVTGTGLGLVISVMLFPAFNDTLLKKRDPLPVIDGFGEFIVLIVLALGVDLLVLTNNPIILYPMALVSAGGVLVLLTLVYSMVIVMLFKLENKYENVSKMITPLIAGFMIAFIQIFILDYLRFMITGSWNGFKFG
jgi:uncharacterized membrane protein